MTSRINGRQVYCVITDVYGHSVTTETASLWVDEPLSTESQPVDTSVEASAEWVSVPVEARGTGLTYCCYYKNASSGKFLEFTCKSAVYSTKIAARVNGRKVYCVITDIHGNSVTTDTATITIES